MVFMCACLCEDKLKMLKFTSFRSLPSLKLVEMEFLDNWKGGHIRHKF